MIEIKALKKSFGKQAVLKGIFFNIKEQGEIVGMVGANGAGKTTLFRCIAGIEEFDGAVSVSKDFNPIGLLLSNPDYLSFMTAEEYLIFMCKARKIEGYNLEDANVFDLPLSKYASKFSTGMKKKLALTALLLQKNQFYILDEPFSGVDFESNLIINQIIQKLKEAGKTILISSHILSSLTDICDEIHFLKNGKIDNSVEKSDFGKINQNLDFINIEEKLSQLNF